MSASQTTYLVIHGWHNSCKSSVDYVESIVYGLPDKVTSVTVGSHFVALVEYVDQPGVARATFDRMGSFPHGANLTYDKVVALREFGSWVYHWAPGSLPRAASPTAS